MGYYVVHMPKGVVKFYKDKQGLPYIDLEGPGQEAAIMLLQCVQSKQGNYTGGWIETAMIQTVQGIYKGYTMNDVLKAKEACRAQGMIGNPSKKDYKGMVSGNLITNCPVTTANINNARAIFGLDLASTRKNSPTNPRAHGGRLCGGALFSGGEQQNSHYGSRCVHCGWNTFPIDNVLANQIHHRGTCACQNSKES
jgi:hypothetical protein